MSVPRIGRPLGSRPHRPRPAATARRKWMQVEQVVDEVAQTQHRAVSGCGVPQVGHRQVGMARSVAATARGVSHAAAIRRSGSG